MSFSPLLEWHSFATISIPGTSGYSAVVSRAGDWTSERIANPPKEIWVRGVPCYGVVRVTPLFRRVVLVATGSGIGPIAPVVYAKKVPIQLLWTAPAVRKTFGDKLVDSLLEANPNAVIYGKSSSVMVVMQKSHCARQTHGNTGNLTWSSSRTGWFNSSMPKPLSSSLTNR